MYSICICIYIYNTCVYVYVSCMLNIFPWMPIYSMLHFKIFKHLNNIFLGPSCIPSWVSNSHAATPRCPGTWPSLWAAWCLGRTLRSWWAHHLPRGCRRGGHNHGQWSWVIRLGCIGDITRHIMCTKSCIFSTYRVYMSYLTPSILNISYIVIMYMVDKNINYIIW